MARLKMHPSVTWERVARMLQETMLTLDNPGLCVACGEETDGVEPDARRYECEHCGEHAVYGLEELALKLGV